MEKPLTYICIKCGRKAPAIKDAYSSYVIDTETMLCTFLNQWGVTEPTDQCREAFLKATDAIDNVKSIQSGSPEEKTLLDAWLEGTLDASKYIENWRSGKGLTP